MLPPLLSRLLPAAFLPCLVARRCRAAHTHPTHTHANAKQALNESQPPGAPLGVGLKVLLVGLTGTGKSELANALLDRPAAARTSPFREATRGVRVLRGSASGVELAVIDTPGLHAASDSALSNRGTLRSIARAYKRHKPDFVLYVDR